MTLISTWTMLLWFLKFSGYEEEVTCHQVHSCLDTDSLWYISSHLTSYWCSGGTQFALKVTDQFCLRTALFTRVGIEKLTCTLPISPTVWLVVSAYLLLNNHPCCKGTQLIYYWYYCSNLTDFSDSGKIKEHGVSFTFFWRARKADWCRVYCIN